MWRVYNLHHASVFTYSHANTPLGQSERAYYLSYFINHFTTCPPEYSFTGDQASSARILAGINVLFSLVGIVRSVMANMAVFSTRRLNFSYHYFYCGRTNPGSCMSASSYCFNSGSVELYMHTRFAVDIFAFHLNNIL